MKELKTVMPKKGRGDVKAQSRWVGPLLLHDPTKNTEETQLTLAPVPGTVLLFLFLAIPQKPIPCEFKTIYFLAQYHLTLSPEEIKTYNKQKS